ncbi:hypothetical protein K456DRAFT_43516 [Colletotrichum gloeosporioides 23]|nr:hypothetical protein K456DRAFT_43516 [Colletotrichum gloeosporioides 23]
MAVSSVTLPSSSLSLVSFRCVFFFAYVLVVVAVSTVDSGKAPIRATTPLLRAKSLGCELQRLRSTKPVFSAKDTGQVSLDFWAKGTDNRQRPRGRNKTSKELEVCANLSVDGRGKCWGDKGCSS